ncbi:hypothetical protein BH10PSE9_BH10PSE9_21460 [soil metagenome]
MGINIKNPEVERLAKEFAQRTGRGQTEAIGVALQEALDRLDRRGLADRIMAIVHKGPTMPPVDWDEELYGGDGLYDRETGLPK